MPVFEEPEPKKLLTGVSYSISGPEEIQHGLKLYLNVNLFTLIIFQHPGY